MRLTGVEVNKVIFYKLLLAINIVAFYLIAISFYAAPPNIDESDIATRPLIYRIDPQIRIYLYVIIVSLIFSVFATALSYLFRKSIDIKKSELGKVFLVEFFIFIGAYLVTYAYLMS